MGKVFSQEHYEQDDWAKYQIIEWLERKGYKACVKVLYLDAYEPCAACSSLLCVSVYLSLSGLNSL